jgi:hypothetical protein
VRTLLVAALLIAGIILLLATLAGFVAGFVVLVWVLVKHNSDA